MTEADLAFVDGPVLSPDASGSDTDAVAVKDGVIVALGDEARSMISPQTEVVSLDAKMLLPGFIDAHVHPVWGGLKLLACDLSAADERRATLEAVAAYVARDPAEPWVLGGGWSMSAFPGGAPTAEDLDQVTAGRPAFLTSRDGHSAWVNTGALRLAGVNEHTPDPADGRIERGPSGKPAGTLHEGAMSVVLKVVPPVSDEQMLRAVLKGQEYLHSFGVTAWQDALVGDYPESRDPGPYYRAADEAGLLTGRVRGALWLERGKTIADQIDSLVARREQYASGRFSPTAVKIMQDGVPENFTAAMSEPYVDRCGHSHGDGLSFFDREDLIDAVKVLDAAGFQIHFHAIGDRAIRDCLDAVAAARAANVYADNRHHMAHLQFLNPNDISRFAHLGIAANLQMLWACDDEQMAELVTPFVGDRHAWQYPFRSLQASGARLAAGSDWSVSTPDPWAAIHVAVNRIPPEHPTDRAEAFLPEQRLSLAAAISAYTSGSAWVNHLDHLVGTIEVGKEADLVVVDRNPFTIKPDELSQTQVLQTFVAGRRVFAAED